MAMNESNQSSLGKAKTLLGLQFLSDCGDQVTIALLALCLLDITQSTNKVGLVYFINTISFVFFTVLGGYLGDIASKRNVIRYSDIGRGLVVLLMIIALHLKSIAFIYVTSFLLSLLGSLHRPVKLSLWAQSVPRHLERYNSFSELSTHVSALIGPLIASVLITYQLTGWGFALDALTFFICALIFSAIIAEQPTPNSCKRNNDLFRGFKLIFADRELYKYVSYAAVQMLAHGAFNATFLVLAQRDFGWSKTEYSYHLAIIAVFAIVSAFFGATKYVANLNAMNKLVNCTIVSAISLGLVLYFKTFPLCSFLFGICNAMAVIAMVVTKTKVQMRGSTVYSDSLASILAARSILIKTATLLGMGGCLIVVHFLSLETTLWLFLLPLVFGFFPVISTEDGITERSSMNFR
jgi:MFS family permease